jgi:hypothetical protein
MRTLTAKLGGQEVTLAATFGASIEIAEKIADPLFIMREAALEVMLSTQHIPYEPKWRFTVANIPQIIEIGMRAAGDKTDGNVIRDLVFAAGFVAAREIASDYLALIVGPRSEEAEATAGKEATEGKPDGSPS